MQETTLGGYKVTANMEKLTLERNGESFTFLPGEAEKINHLLGIALQMQDLEGLPAYIPYTPFIVQFFEDDTLALKRIDDRSLLKLSWKDIDELIQVVTKAVHVSVNDTVQSGSIGRRRAASVDTGEPWL